MSLISQFFACEARQLAAAGRRPDVERLLGEAVGHVDFSGGLHRPWLFPDDFLALTEGGTGSFWRLEAESLIEGADGGLYRVPDAECDKILGLDAARLSRFSAAWNHRRAEENARAARSNAVWKREGFQRIVGGISAGLVVSYFANGRPLDLLLCLAAWLGASIGLALYLSHRNRKRAEARRGGGPVDWVAPLQALQDLHRQARARQVPVYYHWSL